MVEKLVCMKLTYCLTTTVFSQKMTMKTDGIINSIPTFQQDSSSPAKI